MEDEEDPAQTEDVGEQKLWLFNKGKPLPQQAQTSTAQK